MQNLASAFYTRYGEKMPPGLADVLMVACRRETIAFEQIQKIHSSDIEELLLFAWEWKLLIPTASSRSSEWDDRLLLMEAGEAYEMPNISRRLVKAAADSANWDVRGAVSALYRDMGEPEWEKMPPLVAAIAGQAVNHIIGAAAINAACLKTGIRGTTGAMIAILKGGGVISPKLAAIAPVARTRAPVYEVNPSIYPGVRPPC